MKQILYVSDAAGGATRPHLDDILRCSRRNNPELGITGILVVRDTMFVQVIEGPGEHLGAVVDIINDDPRHGNVRILSSRDTPLPSFADWAMGYCSLTHDDPRDAALGDLVDAALRGTDDAAEALMRCLVSMRSEGDGLRGPATQAA